MLRESSIDAAFTKNVSKSTSELLEKLGQTVIKHVDKETKMLVDKMTPALESVRKEIGPAQRVRDNITEYTILKSAVDDPDELAALNRMTGVNISASDAKFILKHYKKTASPVANHADYVKHIGEQSGYAELRDGRLVPVDLAARFKQETGKAIDSVIPSKTIEETMEDGFLEDGQTLLIAAVTGGTLKYKDALTEAARVYGKGSKKYEVVRGNIFKAYIARRRALKSLQTEQEDYSLSRITQGKGGWGDLINGVMKGKNISEINYLEKNFQAKAVESARERYNINDNPNYSLGDLRKELDGILKKAPNVSTSLRLTIVNDVENSIRSQLKEGFDVFYKEARRAGDYDERKVIAFARYERFRAVSNRFSEFSAMTEPERGLKIAQAQSRMPHVQRALGINDSLKSVLIKNGHLTEIEIMEIAIGSSIGRDTRARVNEIKERLKRIYETDPIFKKTPTKTKEPSWFDIVGDSIREGINAGVGRM